MFNLLKKLIKKESKKINEDAIKNRHSPEENPKDFVNEKSNTHDGSNVTTIESETEIFNKGSICASQDEKVICEKPSDLNSGNVKKPIMEIKLEDEIRECFRKDYIEDETFLELFPIEIRPLIHKGILSCYESSLSARANENCQENTSRIFSWLYSLYADLWLHEYGYAEKLALKQHQLCYFDEYGDYCMDEWHKELSTFINKRKLNFERYIREKIPLKYQQYAKDTDNDFHIFPEKDDDLFTIEDHMTDGITLSSVFGYYTERLNNQNSEIDLGKMRISPRCEIIAA
ncbi:MAG: hypothetical protein GY833_26925 [Aestuariibacter sp.]|uniref:hypothetical protein n=1 Tax=Marisediminitalea aggregata TaxID=634436 RepID=UPI0020CFA5E8|nr:hypothetical protein [Marisediminitalea aggregata]MCP4529519.1 hypothetical protein [Aestuariibacter sp.]MCP9479651.1 hypothetical protein [Marisediminitalea aggregata]